MDVPDEDQDLPVGVMLGAVGADALVGALALGVEAAAHPRGVLPVHVGMRGDLAVHYDAGGDDDALLRLLAAAHVSLRVSPEGDAREQGREHGGTTHPYLGTATGPAFALSILTTFRSFRSGSVVKPMPRSTRPSGSVSVKVVSLETRLSRWS